MSEQLTKRPEEQFVQYVDFGSPLNACLVKCFAEDGTDVSDAMLTRRPCQIMGKEAAFFIRGGDPGAEYRLELAFHAMNGERRTETLMLKVEGKPVEMRKAISVAKEPESVPECVVPLVSQLRALTTGRRYRVRDIVRAVEMAKNCGTGAGGFQEGNTCGRGEGGTLSSDTLKLKLKEAQAELKGALRQTGGVVRDQVIAIQKDVSEIAGRVAQAIEDEKGSVDIVFKGKPIRMTLDKQSQASGMKAVFVDTNDLDTEWSKDTNTYIKPGGEGAIKDRYPRFKGFIERNETVNMPVISFDEGRGGRAILFEDGRSRFAVLRDSGIARIPVAVRKEQIKGFKEYFKGSLQKSCGAGEEGSPGFQESNTCGIGDQASPGSRFSGAPKIGKGPSHVVKGAKAALTLFPDHLVRGLSVEYNKDGRSVYQHGKIRLGENEGDGVGIRDLDATSSDMDGEAIKNASFKGSGWDHARPVKSVGEHLTRQVVAHEIGHHVENMIAPEFRKEYEKVFDTHGKNVKTGTMSSYRRHFSRESEDGYKTPEHLARSRLRDEAFAESVRLKATNPSEYRKLPARVRGFVDKIWRSEKMTKADGPETRPSCLQCVEKHLGAALVLLGEERDGYEYRLRIIGHLHEAEDESQEYDALHDAIRDARKKYQEDGTVPDWEKLSGMVEKLQKNEELSKRDEFLSTPFRMEKARQKAEDPVAAKIQKLAQARLDAQREKVLALVRRKMKKADDGDTPASDPSISDEDLYDALADSPLPDSFDAQVGKATSEGGSLQAASMNVGWREADPDVLRFVRERRTNLETVMDDATAKEVKRAIEQGIKESDTEADLINRLTDLGIFGEARAQRIARTESHLAVMKGAHEAMKQNGVKQRQWLAGLDERTRETHLEANGQVVGIDELYEVGDAELRFPGDPDGPPEEVINCRCSELVIRDMGEDLGDELDLDFEEGEEDEPLEDKIREAARSLPKSETSGLDPTRIQSLGVKPMKGRGVDYDVDEGLLRIGAKAPMQQIQDALRQHIVATEVTVADARGFINNLRASKLPEPNGQGSERALAVRALGRVIAGDREGLGAMVGRTLSDAEWARYRAVGAHFWMSPGTPGKPPAKRKPRLD